MSLKFIIQPDKKYAGLTYRSRKVIADEKLLEKLIKVPEAIVVSSWRSLEEQKQMVAKGASKTLKSNHMRGLAVDCVNWSEIEKKMRNVGLINDISWDKNHFALGGEEKAAKEKIYETLPKKLEEFKPKKEAVSSPKSQVGITPKVEVKTQPTPISRESSPILEPTETLPSVEIPVNKQIEITMTKKWYKSRQIWVAIAQGVIGIILSFEASSPEFQALGIGAIAKSGLDIFLRFSTFMEIE